MSDRIRKLQTGQSHNGQKAKHQDKIYDKSIEKVNRSIMQKLRDKNTKEILKRLNN